MTEEDWEIPRPTLNQYVELHYVVGYLKSVECFSDLEEGTLDPAIERLNDYLEEELETNG